MDKNELINRLQHEFDELDKKCKALGGHIVSGKDSEYPIRMKQLLREQLKHMDSYRHCLKERIEFIKNNY